MKHTLLMAALAGMASAAAYADDKPAPTPPEPHGITCEFVPSVTGFSGIDATHIVIEGIGSQKFLVTLASHCNALDYAITIGLERHGSNLCSGDLILAKHDRCLIRSVEKVSGRKEAEAIVAARAAEKQKNQGQNNSH